MANLTLTARPRTVVGKKVRQLRRRGILPAVVYGPALPAPMPIEIDHRAFDAVYRQAGSTQLVDVVFEHDGSRHSLFIKDVQYNLLRRTIDHADFYAANLRVETTLAVPLTLVGEAPVVHRGEGIVMLTQPTVQVRALPTQVPAHLEVDQRILETVDNSFRVEDLVVPEGVTILDAPDTVLVSVTRPQREVEVEAPAETPAAAAAEAAAPQAEGEGTGEAE